MISILIPTYNYKVLSLVSAIHKQLELTNIEYEIRVYDDGSPNPEPENDGINNFKNSVHKKLEKNIGRTAIRNVMASEAKYDWILFLDADVLPKNSNFIESYVKAISNNNCDVIFGGISYEEVRPIREKILRWKYGRAREAKSVTLRQKEPFFIISQNLCIKRSVFLQANTLLENHYGLDNFFSNQLKKMNTKVVHIDNPVIHFGLEENDKFIKKALKAVETTVILEKKELMDDDMRPIQKSYLKLKKLHLSSVFSLIISTFKTTMERNFNSKNPNLFWFDLYRLNYYIKLKKQHNA